MEKNVTLNWMPGFCSRNHRSLERKTRSSLRNHDKFPWSTPAPDLATNGVHETSNRGATREPLVAITCSSAYASWEPVCVRVVDVDAVTVGRLSRKRVLGRQVYPPNFPQRDGTGPVAVGLLNAAGGGGGLARRLGGKLLARGLATGGLTGRLLGTSHGADGSKRRQIGRIPQRKNVDAETSTSATRPEATS